MAISGPEIDWLKSQSGYTDEELTQFESVMGSAKFVSMLQKVHQASEKAAADARKAEDDRLAFEKRYQEEFIPEMRKVTTDAVNARGEAARLAAQLKQAQEYGIVPDSVTPPGNADPQPRAPGSPDPNMISRDDFSRFQSAQANTLVALQDLSAEHFKLFGAPLGNTQELVDEVNRQRTLGHKDFNLRQAWEQKNNVAQKRQEMQAAEQKKREDEIRADERRQITQSQGANPMMRSGVPSRFSTYKPSDATSASKPWQVPAGQRKTAMQPWRDNAVAKLREASV